MSMQSGTGKVRTTYEFIKAHRSTFSVQALCRVLDVAPSGYYAWLKQPLSNRAVEDVRLLRLIRASFVASRPARSISWWSVCPSISSMTM